VATAAARYLDGIAPAELDRLTVEALATARPWIRSQYERHQATRPELARHFLRVILEQHVGELLARDPAARPGDDSSTP
jgi:hypothetical protein